MMAKIEDVFQIIRDRNLKNGSENHYANKKPDQRSHDTKKKGRNDEKEKFPKIEKKFDRRSRSRSPKRRFNDRSHRDRVPRDRNRYHKDNRYNNRFTQSGKRNRSRDFDKKKKDNRRSSSSSSDDHKNKKRVRNGNSFSLSPEVKD